MKVLLTGASGFVGSHVLDSLCRHNLATAILIRSRSSPSFIEKHLPVIEIRQGALDQPASLRAAVEGITHVIHCAGATKACTLREFHTINQEGTRNLAKAAAREGVRTFLQVSSLAAAGPTRQGRPVTETDPPQPVSEYGRSKLAAEDEVRRLCPEGFIIVRPPAVYGPRDREFLAIFKAVKGHLLPRPARQPLSLVYAEDLAEVIVALLLRDGPAGRAYFVCSDEVTSSRELAEAVACSMGGWTIPLPLPTPALWPVCLWREVRSRLTGTPSVLNLQKYAELRAPGWVCSPGLLRQETGLQCHTKLAEGLRRTLEWYRANGWL